MRKKAAEPRNCQTPLLGYRRLCVTVFETMQEEEIEILTPLFLITDSWLWVLILHKPLDSSWSGWGAHSSWGMGLLCFPFRGWELKPPFYFLQTPFLYVLFGFSGQRKPRLWQQEDAGLPDPLHALRHLSAGFRLGKEGRQVQRYAVPECGVTGKQTEDKEAFPIGEHLPPQSK